MIKSVIVNYFSWLTPVAELSNMANMNIDEKAQELSLALIKLSAYSRRRAFGRKLEYIALSLIEEVSRRDFDSLHRTLRSMEGFMRFGRLIYEIEPINADILLEEIHKFTSEVKKVAFIEKDDVYDSKNTLEEIFSKPLSLFEKPKQPPKKKARNEKKTFSQSAIAHNENNTAKEDISNSNEIAELKEDKDKSEYSNPAIRQTAIVNKMRQFDNNEAKLKDIITAFPEFSERTLRYDLQSLSSDGSIDRVGQGGPGTYYKAL